MTTSSSDSERMRSRSPIGQQAYIPRPNSYGALDPEWLWSLFDKQGNIFVHSMFHAGRAQFARQRNPIESRLSDFEY
jgi:hypothetical protein